MTNPVMDVFGGAPRFLTSPRTFTVQSGTSAVLKWQVAGEPRPSVAWEKDGSVLELPSGRMFVKADGDAYSLLVSQAGPGDSGRYVCKAKNTVGETYAAATLKVEGAELKPKGDLDTQPPFFLNRPVSARVIRGEDVTFACRVSGQLEWEKDGHKLTDIFESSHYKVSVEPDDWHSLHIYNTRLPDAGVYVCRAMNSFGEAVAAAVLLVDSVPCVPYDGLFPNASQNCHFKKQPEGHDDKQQRYRPGQNVIPEARQNGEAFPSLPTAKAFTVNEGKHAKFRCYVTGKPKPEIVWRKDGRVLSPGRRHLVYEDREGYFILKVLYCTARDCGLYVCTACNTAGHTLSAVRLHVKEPRLRFQMPLVDVEVLEHQDAVLECQVPLETIPTVWYLEDKRLQPSPKYLMEEQGLLRRLTVRDARADDDGIYLCEMEGKGRSVGELSVHGMIVKRLPRKLDVMEGENAAFCVETRELVEASSWGRNGQELMEGPHTLIRSFGKTHLLVLVQVTRHDAGVITFTAGESQTSVQLRVKCAKRIPPSAPVAARMCMAHSNAALLTWCPPPDVHHSLPSSYILERQAVGDAEWVPCLTTDVASTVEVPGDGVPQEADYRFRVCSANQYGCSGHVEFPGSVHLVPRARVQIGLQDVQVHVGEDAVFSVQLSAAVSGNWFLNGKRLEEEDQQCQITQSGVDHTMRINNVQVAAMESKVRFEANGVKECAVLNVQAPQVHITPVPEARRQRALLAGMPLALECEVSTPDGTVCWLKDGSPVALDDRVCAVQSEGNIRRLLIPSVCSVDSGTYTCDAGADAINFTVTVDEPPVRAVHSNAQEAHAYQVAERVVLACELSRPEAPVRWLKDGKVVEESEALLLESEGPHRRLVIPSAQVGDAGEFVCDMDGESVFFSISVAEPPVRVVHSSTEEAHAYQAADRVVLACELSCPNAPVRWYKDGEEVEESEAILLESEGPHRRLIIPSAQVHDAGEFVCDAGGDSAFFNITVTEPPVQVVYSNADKAHTYQVSERVVLACELSRPNVPVHWYKDGEEVEVGEDLLLENEGSHHQLAIPSARVQDSGEFVCDAGGDSVFFSVTVTEPPVRVVHSSAEEAHAYQAADRVVLACELSRPNAPVRWYKDGEEVEESEALLLESEGPHRRLIIPSAQTHDAGEFVCDAGGDSAFFNITVTETPVQIVHSNADVAHTYQASERVVLACVLSRPNVPVHWYKDGEEMEAGEHLQLESEGTHQRLIISSAQVEDTGEFVCDAGGDSAFFSVTVAAPKVHITPLSEAQCLRTVLAGMPLLLECEVSASDAPVQWFKDGDPVPLDDDNLTVQSEGCIRQLLIHSACPLDSGTYTCDTADDTMEFTVTVDELPVHVVCSNADAAHVYQVAQRVVLGCELSSTDALVSWYKDGEEVEEKDGFLLESEGPHRRLVILAAQAQDTGEFVCDAGGDSVFFSVTVAEPPMRILQPVERSLEKQVWALERLELSCEVSMPEASVRWFKDGLEVDETHNLLLQTEGAKRLLVILQASAEDAGEYICETKDESVSFDVRVSELPMKFVRGLSDVSALQGDSVLFWCELCKTKGDVLWMKDGQELEPNERLEIRAEGRERSLTLSHVGPEDAGEYSCESKDDRTLAILTVQIPRFVEIISELHNLTVLEGDDATFKVVMSPDNVALKWHLNGQEVVPSERFTTTRNGLCHTLTIRQCRLSDSGTITVNAEGLVSTARLSVQEAQVLFVQTLHDLVVEEGQDMRLEVKLSLENAEVQWMKQGILLQPSVKYSMEAHGHQRALTIHNVELSDRGTYRCESLHDRTQARLNVEPRRVTVRKPLLDVETVEKETVTFELELSHANVPGVWTRDGVRMKPSSTCRVSTTGCVHSLTLMGLTLDDSGTVAFTADTVRSSARLLVQEPPITMLRFPQDMSIPETGVATFECELSRPLAEVKWYKDGEEIQIGPSCRMYSVGRRRLLQLSHCSLEDAGEYMCDAGDCRASARLRVFERQVQIVRELEDVRVRENENAVFRCEVSLEEVKGEWFLDGDRIKVTSTVKIRQEGTRHFLLLCCVRPEDAGQIRFVAKGATTEACLEVEALPIRIVKPLRDKTVLARHKATLECTVSQSRGRVRWFRGDTEIFAGQKYEICNLDCYRTLVIHCVEPADEGLYTCDALDDRSTARLLVEAEGIQVMRALRSVEVVAPSEAQFECEISAPPSCTAQWSLNGEELQPSSQVQMESVGHIHRMRLRRTTPGMSGMVKVTVGSARSKARLTVREG
ncbi:obscurin-like protein 1 isoform X5 [Paroedura picta]|uniref:obscurin-like protein 1 isoform X5 n=1 Tax=Paroedura picta TaxID=143630 RepID=UPI00405696E7